MSLTVPLWIRTLIGPAIKTACDNFVIFQGNDDPYVSMSQAKTISENLDTPIQVLEKAGHINADTGYTNFSEILDFIND